MTNATRTMTMAAQGWSEGGAMIVRAWAVGALAIGAFILYAARARMQP